MNFSKKNHEHRRTNEKSVSKNKIRKLMLAALFVVLIGNNASAQGMPVYDNTNFISLVKQLLESGKQTAEMIKTVKFLKDAKESIEKVSRGEYCGITINLTKIIFSESINDDYSIINLK